MIMQYTHSLLLPCLVLSQSLCEASPRGKPHAVSDRRTPSARATPRHRSSVHHDAAPGTLTRKHTCSACDSLSRARSSQQQPAVVSAGRCRCEDSRRTCMHMHTHLRIPKHTVRHHIPTCTPACVLGRGRRGTNRRGKKHCSTACAMPGRNVYIGMYT